MIFHHLSLQKSQELKFILHWLIFFLLILLGFLLPLLLLALLLLTLALALLVLLLLLTRLLNIDKIEILIDLLNHLLFLPLFLLWGLRLLAFGKGGWRLFAWWFYFGKTRRNIAWLLHWHRHIKLLKLLLVVIFNLSSRSRSRRRNYFRLFLNQMFGAFHCHCWNVLFPFPFLFHHWNIWKGLILLIGGRHFLKFLKIPILFLFFKSQHIPF